MQHDNIQKSFILDSPHSLNLHRRSDLGIQSNIQSDIIHIYCFYLSAYKVSVIILKIDLVIAKFMYLTFDPALRFMWAGYLFFTFYTVILIYRLFIHNSFGEMFRSLL